MGKAFRFGDPAYRTRTSVLLSYARWPAAGASIVQAILLLQGPARTAGIGIGVGLAAYNLLGRRVPLLGLAGDFAVATGWTVLTAGDAHSLTFAFFICVGMEAAFLYGRAGAAAVIAAFLAFLLGITLSGAPAFAGSLAAGLIDRALLMLLLTGFAVGVAEHVTQEKQRLRAAEERTRTVIEGAPSAVITADEAGLITGWNQRAAETFGWEAGDVLGRPLAAVVLAGTPSGGEIRPGVRRLVGIRRSGIEFPIELTTSQARTPTGEPQLIVFADDVTYRQRGEALQAARYAVTIAINQAYSIEDGVPGVLQGVCQSMGWAVGVLWRLDVEAGGLRFEALWHSDGISGPDLEESARFKILSPGDELPGKAWAAEAAVTVADLSGEDDERELDLAAEGLHAGLAFPVRHGDEFLGVLEFYMHSTQTADDETLIAMADIGVQVGQWLEREMIRTRLRGEEEARRDAEERARRALEFRAFHDMLTGLPNRHLFADRLGQRVALAKREQTALAVMMLDVDLFKYVNDTFGHFAGDLVLEEVARRLRAELRTSDTAARMGGDEFAVLPGGDADRVAVEQIAGKIKEAFAKPFYVEGTPVELGVSIGCAFFPEDGSEAGQLLEMADAAMYQAKRAAGTAAPTDTPH